MSHFRYSLTKTARNVEGLFIKVLLHTIYIENDSQNLHIISNIS